MRIGEPQPDTPSRPLVIGIDGGGTKTIAWVARVELDQHNGPSIDVIGKGSAGGSNATTRGAGAAAAAVVQAVNAAFDDAGLGARPVGAMVCGLAGTGDPAVRAEVDHAIRQAGLARVNHVTDDVSPVLRAATDARDEGATRAKTTIVIASGTGSIARGRDARGATARAGGHGPAHGDPGSGYAIGLAAIHRALNDPPHEPGGAVLRERVLDALNLPCPDALRAWLASASATPPAIASLAKPVIRASGRSPAAMQIVGAAASDLSQCIASVYAQLGAKPGNDDLLAMTGGVLCGQDTVSSAVLKHLDEQALSPARWIKINAPVRGATLLAADLLADQPLPQYGRG